MIGAKFKCQTCGKEQEQNVEIYGLVVRNCFECGGVFLDCLNLQECLDECVKLDAVCGYKEGVSPLTCTKGKCRIHR